MSKLFALLLLIGLVAYASAAPSDKVEAPEKIEAPEKMEAPEEVEAPEEAEANEQDEEQKEQDEEPKEQDEEDPAVEQVDEKSELDEPESEDDEAEQTESEVPEYEDPQSKDENDESAPEKRGVVRRCVKWGRRICCYPRRPCRGRGVGGHMRCLMNLFRRHRCRVQRYCRKYRTYRFKYVHVCEHRSKVLRCPRGRKLRIFYANYGRTSSKVCRFILKNVRNTRCRSSFSSRLIHCACNGRSYCRLYAKNLVYGDPCRGTYKYIAVHYICV